MVEALVFLPLFAALVSGLFCRKLSDKFVNYLNTILLLISAILSWFVFSKVVLAGELVLVDLSDWLIVGKFSSKWALKVDSLTSVMLVVVTNVSALVHLYSIGYMVHDPHKQRFMSYLSAFTFFMLMLVTSDNLLQLFFGWEGVGLCSYLLIGFWFQKKSACRAAIKAFVVNRVGDLAFLLGIFAVYMIFGSIEFSVIFSKAAQFSNETINILAVEYNAIDVICILLFIGAMGKSAQIGLHVWLPDAMEGPTPVSALIHAATMVTAGVFLVARFSPLYEMSELSRAMVTVVGAVTCLFAATIAVTQDDIKKIIAYSTCSQLGYMFFACGVSAYGAAIFHLMTHACFKALLFLAAGSVIHAVSDEQNIQKMGGLWKKIPVTYTMFWIGSLALAGFYPFAGFYSKDAILEAAYVDGSKFGLMAFWLGLAAAFLTALYSFRLIIRVFHGDFRGSEHARKHLHESPIVMLLPLIILAIGSIFSGFSFESLGILISGDGDFWHGAIIQSPEILEKMHHLDSAIKFLPLIAGSAGVFMAYVLYSLWPCLADLLMRIFSPIHKLLQNKYYIDEIYDVIFVNPALCLARIFWRVVDIKLIDALLPDGAAYLSRISGKFVNRLQSGLIYNYTFLMILVVVIMVSVYAFNF